MVDLLEADFWPRVGLPVIRPESPLRTRVTCLFARF